MCIRPHLQIRVNADPEEKNIHNAKSYLYCPLAQGFGKIFHSLADFKLFNKIRPKFTTEEMRKEAHILKGLPPAQIFHAEITIFSFSECDSVKLCSLKGYLS